MTQTLAVVFDALINLDRPGHFFKLGFIQISYPNLIMMSMVVVLFVLAVLLPFPHGKRSDTK